MDHPFPWDDIVASLSPSHQPLLMTLALRHRGRNGPTDSTTPCDRFQRFGFSRRTHPRPTVRCTVSGCAVYQTFHRASLHTGCVCTTLPTSECAGQEDDVGGPPCDLNGEQQPAGRGTRVQTTAVVVYTEKMTGGRNQTTHSPTQSLGRDTVRVGEEKNSKMRVRIVVNFDLSVFFLLPGFFLTVCVVSDSKFKICL